MTRGYRFLDHTADFGLEIFGRDAPHLFEEAANALFDFITGPSEPKQSRQHKVEVSGHDWADLSVF